MVHTFKHYISFKYYHSSQSIEKVVVSQLINTYNPPSSSFKHTVHKMYTDIVSTSTTKTAIDKHQQTEQDYDSGWGHLQIMLLLKHKAHQEVDS